MYINLTSLHAYNQSAIFLLLPSVLNLQPSSCFSNIVSFNNPKYFIHSLNSIVIPVVVMLLRCLIFLIRLTQHGVNRLVEFIAAHKAELQQQPALRAELETPATKNRRRDFIY